MKRCFKCKAVKPLTEFYRHSAMSDGHLGKCKECAKKDATASRLAKIEHYRSYDRRRASMPHRLAKNREITARWRTQHPERRAAQVAVGNALRDGRIVQLPCLMCGQEAEAHHTHYDAPLEVVWLCPSHHKQAHAMARAA